MRSLIIVFCLLISFPTFAEKKEYKKLDEDKLELKMTEMERTIIYKVEDLKNAIAKYKEEIAELQAQIDVWEDYETWWYMQYANDPIWGDYVKESEDEKSEDTKNLISHNKKKSERKR